MVKDKLIEYVEMGFSISEISKKENKSRTTVRYWLNKFGLKTKNLSFSETKPIEYGDYKFCPRCKENVQIENFYNRRGKKFSSVYCKQCTSNQTLERQRKLKKQCVEYKGGKCVCCGYDKYNGALEFHHVDSSKKDFTIAYLKLYTFNDEIKKELDKCVLVCSNCHREIHGKLIKL